MNLANTEFTTSSSLTLDGSPSPLPTKKTATSDEMAERQLTKKMRLAQGTQIFILHTETLTQDDRPNLNKDSQLSSKNTEMVGTRMRSDKYKGCLLDGTMLGEAGSRHGFVPLKPTVKRKSKGA